MKKTTRYNLFVATAYALVLIVGMVLGIKFIKDQGYRVEKPLPYANNTDQKRDDILHLIKKKYVDDVNADSLQHLPIDSLLHQLDPHSAYLPAEEADELSDDLEGNFEGIGVEYYILNDTLLVTGVLRDGPAFIGGLRSGDKIIKVDSTVVSGRSLPRSEMTGRIKGKRGTPVQLTVARQGVPGAVSLSIKRGKVLVSSIDVAYMLNAETGYMRISKFGANTDKDFIEAIKVLKARGMRKLVLDLRDNGGGYVSAATGLANQFLQENKLIVYTEGKHEPRTDYFSTGGGEFEQGKLAVLINENSASASEIFAGAIQDLDRGIIIGRRSFGKGLVQEQFPFDDGSALNLTIARYYTPLGRSIQKSYKRGYAAYHKELDERFNDGELMQGNAKVTDSLQRGNVFVTASGKKVFGGGGIQPDVFVRLDTSGYNKFYMRLVDNNVLIDYVFQTLVHRYTADYLLQNINTFSINDNDFKTFVNYLHQRQIKTDARQLSASRALISNDMKVMLCKYYLGDWGYYRASNLSDPVVKQAVASLQ